MANPSSSHRDHDREPRDRERRERDRSHRSHRTISSTTLLLTLSLILAVLAVMLSLPSSRTPTPPVVPVPPADPDAANSGLWGYLTPKRSQALVSRESEVAHREAEVARREAELLVGSPAGISVQTACPACPTVTETIETIRVAPPAQTIYQEIVKDEVAPPNWTRDYGRRIEEILERESKIAEREKEIGRREEAVNRREHDASRRETWIMEQLIALGDEPLVEEEYVYEPSGKRKLKALPPLMAAPLTPKTITHYHTLVETASPKTATITVPAPANTRQVPQPSPVSVSSSSAPASGPTKVVEYVIDDRGNPVAEEDEPKRVTVTRKKQRQRAWLPWRG
ncbi:hypothetical protein BD410DRAFT_812488 [Rickenella mellea]|uniref:Uncharacterized protein n=1 Tax=Rickenella mellea TaxID=50990 RepID=A0A4Y7QK85_9AGAM|nr:hypothetical protein BD410DRAFT_812488 [Rickenella mellea]